MTSTRCEIFNWALIPLTAVVTLFTCPYIYSLNSGINKDLEIIMIYIMALVVTLEHIHYGICMVIKIVIFFFICFKINFNIFYKGSSNMQSFKYLLFCNHFKTTTKH